MHFRHVLAVFLSAFVFAAQSAHAQALPVGVSPVFTPTITPTGFNYAGGVATSANAASITFGNSANGALYAQTTQRVALGSGATADLVMRSTPTAASVAGALGRFAAKVATPLVVGVALYDLAKELGFTVNSSGGRVVVLKPDPSACSVAPCYGYRFNVGGVQYYSVSAAAAAAVAIFGAGYSYSGHFVPSPDGYQNGQLFLDYTSSDGSVRPDITSIPGVPYSVPPVTDATLPSSIQELQDAIASKAGWPSGSALPRAVEDAVKAGEPLPLPAPNSITGPGVVQLPPKVVTNPDGSTVTTTPNKTITYVPPSIVVGNTVTSAGTSASGQPTGTTSTSSPNEMPETCGYPGGPPCKIDETGTPEGNSAYDDAKTALDTQATKLDDAMKDVTKTEGKDTSWTLPSWLSTGQCSPVVLLTFPPALGSYAVGFDICPQLPMIYTLMNTLWVISTFFIVVNMVFQVTTGAKQ